MSNQLFNHLCGKSDYLDKKMLRHSTIDLRHGVSWDYERLKLMENSVKSLNLVDNNPTPYSVTLNETPNFQYYF